MDTKSITTAWDRVRELGTVTYRQFDWWIRSGYVNVQAPFGTGSGFPRTITDDELNVVAWMGRLTALGIDPSRAVILGRQLAIRHGTERGARAHRRKGESVCGACLAGERAATRDRKRYRSRGKVA